MEPIPIYDATEPVACTIGGDDVAERIELIERMRDALERVERTAHGMLLHFPNRADVDADVRRFAVDEKQCCRFWGFAVVVDGDHLTLRWDGPPAADDVLDQLVAYFEGDEPLTGISGLL